MVTFNFHLAKWSFLLVAVFNLHLSSIIFFNRLFGFLVRGVLDLA